MNKFLAILCFALVANAKANSGYNYPQPIGNQIFRPSTPFGSNVAAAIVPLPGSQYIPPANAQYSQQQFAPPTQSITQPSQYVPPFQQPPVYNNQQQQQQQQTIVSSNIQIHSAPEETEEIYLDQGAEGAPIRKNYRILFVKAPTQNLKFNLNSIKQAQAASAEKTVVYVLSKNPDVSTFYSQLNSIQSAQKIHKPEVYFIKYKTPAEANRAQEEIQAQYDALGGTTSISDEGFAPITSVVGGGPINVGLSSSLSAPSFSGSSNFAQSASNIQQNFIQSNFQTNQGSASSASFGIALPDPRYLPAKKQ